MVAVSVSLLVAETIYPDGENFGNLIDAEIMEIVSSPTGMGQYDRGFVCAYTNVMAQFIPDLRGRVWDRFGEEAIALFYMELILMEEAAIHIMDQAIIKLFSSDDFASPTAFLKRVDAIYDNYSKTIDFWDIRMNYPTSQKSVALFRNAFRIKEQLENMQRNREQLQAVFDTKCDIIDRTDAKRMDTSLAILSVLAIFSAWIDGHDYIATWGDVFSSPVVGVLQRVFFFAVLFIGAYAMTRLFGHRIAALLGKGHRRLGKADKGQKRKRS